MRESTPVFFDFEASDVEGYPIEIGWAFVDPQTNEIISESHLIKPASGWRMKDSWDRSAERLHGIPLEKVIHEGRSVVEVATRVNAALSGRELFSDAPHDKHWLNLLFEAAALERSFVVSDTDALAMI